MSDWTNETLMFSTLGTALTGRSPRPALPGLAPSGILDSKFILQVSADRLAVPLKCRPTMPSGTQ